MCVVGVICAAAVLQPWTANGSGDQTGATWIYVLFQPFEVLAFTAEL